MAGPTDPNIRAKFDELFARMSKGVKYPCGDGMNTYITLDQMVEWVASWSQYDAGNRLCIMKYANEINDHLNHLNKTKR